LQALHMAGFERKHFWMCFDCVINEFPFWWHFPDLSFSLVLSELISTTHPYLLFPFAAANPILIVWFCNSGRISNKHLYQFCLEWFLTEKSHKTLVTIKWCYLLAN
jgi:hypothetical protein